MEQTVVLLGAPPPFRAEEHLPEGVSELGAAEGIDGGVDEGVAHQQRHVQLEQRAVALAVRVGVARHDEDEVEEERRPAHHEGPEQDGERHRASHAAAAPTVSLALHARGVSGDLSGVATCQQEHVDVEEDDEQQGDGEDGYEEGLDEGSVEKAHHEHGRHAARRPDEGQDGGRPPHSHDVVIAERVEDSEVAVQGR